MDARNRRTLRSELGIRIPAGIEQDKNRTDMVLRGDGQELIDTLCEARGVLLPEEVVQKNPHGLHAHTFRPSQFLVDLIGIKSFGLPHLEFINCSGGQVVFLLSPHVLFFSTAIPPLSTSLHDSYA